ASRLQQLTDADVDEEWRPRHGQPVTDDLAILGLLERLRDLDQLVPALGYFQTLLVQQILAIDEERGGGRVADAIGAALPAAEAAKRVHDVVLAERVGEVLDGTQQALGREGHAGDGLP